MCPSTAEFWPGLEICPIYKPYYKSTIYKSILSDMYTHYLWVYIYSEFGDLGFKLSLFRGMGVMKQKSRYWTLSWDFC